MNYMRELNAFFDWLESNPCSTGAVALWYTLMAINNRADWREEFTVSNLTLQAKTGLSRPQLDRCRNFLVQRGLIRYEKSGKVNQAGKYSMVSLVKYETRHDTPQETPHELPMRHGTSVGRDTGRAHYLDKTETKPNIIINVNARRIVQAYEQAYGRPANPIQIDELCAWVDKGMAPEIAEMAIRKARVKDADLSYALRVLENSWDRGIRSVADMEAYEAKRQAAATHGNKGHSQTKDQRDERYSAFYELFPDS